MKRSQRVDPAVLAGFAVGVGAVFVATLGVYWRFWQPGTSVFVWGLGSFAIGAVVGLVWAWVRRGRRA